MLQMAHTRLQTKLKHEFEVLAPVVMKSHIFWDVTPYSPLKISSTEPNPSYCLLQRAFSLGSFFDSEDGSGIFRLNVGWLL
jgi:hypothetical protein